MDTVATATTCILVCREGMGEGEPALQLKLLRTYLALLLEDGRLPEAIGFYTEGVRLVTEASPILDLLVELQTRGVHLIVCRTCLEFYGVTDRVRVGIVGGMGDILAAQLKAARVISI